MTRIGKDHLIAAGAVIEKVRRDGGADIERVVIDGKDVDLRKARAAFAAAAAVPTAETAEDPGRLEQLLDKLEGKVDGFEDRLDRSRMGHVVANALRKDPERVTSRSVVEIDLADGTTLSVPVEVLHRNATAALQKASLGTSIIAMLPLVGQLARAGTALISGVAALVTLAIGKRHLAAALGSTALKHVTLTGIGFVPLVSNLAGSLAIVGDRTDLKELRRPATVEDTVNLGGGG